MELSEHDFRILHLALRDVEGRLSYRISEEGAILLSGARSGECLPAEDSLPRLEDLGLLKRELNRSYVLTPEGWDVAAAPQAQEA